MQIPEPTSVMLAVVAGSLFGFLSVPHCLGMCGPLHLAMCLSGPRKSFRTLTLFNLGRILGYTLIGLLLGLLGEQITRLAGASGAPPTSHLAVPRSCCETAENVAETSAQIAVPKSCCEQPSAVSHQPSAKGQQPMTQSQPSSSASSALSVPASCCEQPSVVSQQPIANSQQPMTHSQPSPPASSGLAVPNSCCPQPAASNQQPTRPLVVMGAGIRRILMYVFPAAVLLAVGMGALRKSAVTSGQAGLSGLMGHFFKRFRTSGPLACGGIASLLPCGMLYVAFAIAASTLSWLLGGVFLLFYCLTISVFIQLSIMVSTAFGRSFGTKLNQAYPWLAFAGAAVYLGLYVRAVS